MAVVTPSGESSTAPGAGVWVSELVGVVDVGPGDDVGPPSVPDEQPAIATAAAATTQRAYLRMPPIYATLAAMTELTGFLECCSA
jgi:hypothetical protein